MTRASLTWPSSENLSKVTYNETVLQYSRFFERIAKTYRREKWDAMLLPLLSTWYACAQQLGDVELSVNLLLEMLAHGALFLHARVRT